jgi:hypothetical protein
VTDFLCVNLGHRITKSANQTADEIVLRDLFVELLGDGIKEDLFGILWKIGFSG